MIRRCVVGIACIDKGVGRCREREMNIHFIIYVCCVMCFCVSV